MLLENTIFKVIWVILNDIQNNINRNFINYVNHDAVEI